MNLSPEAIRIINVTGNRELGILAQRVFDLQAQVNFQQEKIEALEQSGVPAHLRDVEKR